MSDTAVSPGRAVAPEGAPADGAASVRGPRPLRRFLAPLVAVVALVVVATQELDPTWQGIFVIGVAWGITAVALDVWQGLTGELSFGHGAFVAVGAYAWANLRESAELGILPALVLTVLVTAVLAGVIGLAVVQLSHFGSAIVTFFLAFVVASAAHSRSFSSLTGGQAGHIVPPLEVGGTDYATPDKLLFVAIGLLAVVLFLTVNYKASTSGRALRLIKESPEVASLLGVRIKVAKWKAFVFTASAAALTGIVIGQFLTFVTPDTFNAAASIAIVAMIVIGGQGTIVGALVGALIWFAVPEIVPTSDLAQPAVTAVAFLLFLILAPVGLLGVVPTALRALRRRTGEGGGGAPAPVLHRHDAALAAAASDEPTATRPPIDQAATPAIEVRDVSVEFLGVQALAGVDLRVAPGEVRALIGPNGAGKTTLINVITGIQPATSGEVLASGERISGLRPPAIRSKGVARTFQNSSLVMELSVFDNVRLGRYSDERQSLLRDLLLGRSSRAAEREGAERAAAALRRVGIPEDQWARPAADLSMADRKLVDVARALSSEPAVLLLDEPTAGLGEDEMAAVAHALRALRDSGDITMIVVAHHVAFVRRIADTATVLDAGAVLADGPPDEVTEDPRVLEAFMGRESDGDAPAPRTGTGTGAARPASAPAADAAAGGLVVEGLRCGYGAARVLEDVTLSVGPGELVGLTGRNGAGKSTLLRALSGVIARSARRVEVGGAELAPSPDLAVRAGLIHVPEGRGVVPGLTVLENLQVGALAAGKPWNDAKLAEVLRRFPILEPLLRQRAGLLSGGQQQMLAIARGLVAEPRVLLIDELSLGLSPKATVDVLAAVVEIARDDGPGVLLVDQSIRTLANACDRLYVIKDGVSAEVGAEETETRGALQDVYF